jgi:hypothetical protein
MIDAKPIIPCAKPGIFALVWMAVPPQIAKPDLLDRIHVMRCRVDRSRLIDICATRSTSAREIGFATDSLLEGDGFELPVPLTEARDILVLVTKFKILSRSTR